MNKSKLLNDNLEPGTVCKGALSRAVLCASVLSTGSVGANQASTTDGVAVDPSVQLASIEEIVITATRRETSLQDTALTIQAIDEEILEDLGATSIDDFASFVPGLNRIGTNFVIRGLSSVAAGGRANSNTTSRYLDEIPIDHDFHLFDVQRIEVLKGPQGTLYGAGAMGGAIRIVTHQPDFEELEGRVAAKLSSTGDGGQNYEVNAMINVPLVENTLAARIVAYDTDDEGYIDNVGLGVDDINDRQKSGVRAALRWDTTDDLSITASYLYEKAEQGTRNNASNVGYGELESFSLIEGGQERVVSVANLLVNLDLGWATLTSNTANTKNKFLVPATDATALLNPAIGGLLSLFSGGAIVNSDPYAVLYQDFSNDEATSLTQELRLVSQHDGPFEWVVGGFYRKDDLGPNNILIYADEKDPDNPVFLGFEAGGFTGFGLNPGFVPFDDPRLFFDASQLKGDETEKALFGELTFHLSEQFYATVGARYLDVKQEYESSTKSSLLLLNNPSDVFGTDQSETYFKGLLGYKPTDDVLVYLNWAEGFRRGGANPSASVALGATQNINVPESYTSDTVDSMELGAHTAWFDNRLILNGSIYRQTWEDIRVDVRSGVNYTTNGAEAVIKGLELELQAQPMTGLNLLLTANYIDPELTEGSTALADKGQRLPAQPEYTYSLSASYDMPDLVAGFDGYIRVDSSYTGASYNTFASGPASITRLRTKMDSFTLTNLRLGLNKGKDIDVSLFVENLTDKRAELFVDQASFGRQVIERNRPRTIGIDFSKSF